MHKSTLTKKFKENFEIEEFHVKKESPKSYARKSVNEQPEDSPPSKRTKIEMIDEYHDEIVYEDYNSPPDLDQSDQHEEEKLEIVFLPNESQEEVVSVVNHVQLPSSSTPEMSREEKFINCVYPQFKGKTKLELIENILDLKRRNELLEVKAKTYENTINRLLN